jgi:hypothetical protein
MIKLASVRTITLYGKIIGQKHGNVFRGRIKSVNHCQKDKKTTQSIKSKSATIINRKVQI